MNVCVAHAFPDLYMQLGITICAMWFPSDTSITWTFRWKECQMVFMGLFRGGWGARVMAGGKASPVAVLEAAAAAAAPKHASDSEGAAQDLGLSAVRGERSRLDEGALQMAMVSRGLGFLRVRVVSSHAAPGISYNREHSVASRVQHPADTEAVEIACWPARQGDAPGALLRVPSEGVTQCSVPCCAGARLRAWLRASLNQQALGARLLALYRQQSLLAQWYTRWGLAVTPPFSANLCDCIQSTEGGDGLTADKQQELQPDVVGIARVRIAEEHPNVHARQRACCLCTTTVASEHARPPALHLTALSDITAGVPHCVSRTWQPSCWDCCQRWTAYPLRSALTRQLPMPQQPPDPCSKAAAEGSPRQRLPGRRGGCLRQAQPAQQQPVLQPQPQRQRQWQPQRQRHTRQMAAFSRPLAGCWADATPLRSRLQLRPRPSRATGDFSALHSSSA